jgi:hypothetical protein
MMADDIDETHLENPASIQPENPATEIIPAKNTETIKSKEETESMEVHHHPDLHHKPKKWKEYFLEFLMIFLAVTMGFIAENIREHFTESKVAHQNLEAYRMDLLQNKNLLFRIDSIFSNRLPLYDSIVSIFYEKNENNENNELPVISRLLLAGQRNTVIAINTPTYEQLISSGSMRYIDNSQLKDSIANYQNKIRLLINYNDRIITTLNNQLGEIGKIIDMHDFWNTKQDYSGYGYTPVMQRFALSQEQRNFIIEYNKIFTVQAIWISIYTKSLLNSNASLVWMIDRELNK